jgi:exodeoxyribonuclease VII large subunit
MGQMPLNLNLQPEKKIWTVAELTVRIRDLLAAEFRDVTVTGEISNLRVAPSRHIYFTLKDERAQIKCVCFQSQARFLKFKPGDGQQVMVRGSLGVYEQRGDYQINVVTIEPIGQGALQLAFEQLKKKLAAEGLFAPERKKPLPLLPRRIGVVTSPSGAAVRDVLRVLRRRFPNLHILLYPARVQGDGAKDEIAAGLKYFNRRPPEGRVDVILLVRGGGSLEDLWAFNEEDVARAIAASAIPVISGVGHETDFTIADFVADVRASTPSNAAEIVVKTRLEFETQVAHLRRALAERMRYLLLGLRHRLRELATHPNFLLVPDLLRQHQQRLDDLSGRMAELLDVRLNGIRQRTAVAQARLAAFDLRSRVAALRARLEQRDSDLRSRIERLLTRKREQFERATLRLDERSPLGILARGYAIVTNAQGMSIRDAAQVSVGESIGVRLHRGRLLGDVRKKIAEEE